MILTTLGEWDVATFARLRSPAMPFQRARLERVTMCADISCGVNRNRASWYSRLWPRALRPRLHQMLVCSSITLNRSSALSKTSTTSGEPRLILAQSILPSTRQMILLLFVRNLDKKMKGRLTIGAGPYAVWGPTSGNRLSYGSKRLCSRSFCSSRRTVRS